MIVRGLVEEVRIIGGLVFTQIDFAQQIRFHQQAQGPVNGSSRGFGIDLPDPVEELIRCEMVVLGECHLDDDIALIGSSQTFAPDEIIEPFLDATVHSVFLRGEVRDGKPKRWFDCFRFVNKSRDNQVLTL